MKTAAELREQHDQAQTELQQVQAEIARTIADDGSPKALQRKRDSLQTKIRDLTPAIEIAQKREDDEAAKAAEASAEQARQIANAATEKLLKAAQNLDDKIAELGAAYEQYRLTLMDADQAHRPANSDLSRVVRATTHGLRWALAHGARHLFDDSGLPRVPTHRAQPFTETVRRCASRL